DLVSHGHDLAQLVGDENHGGPLPDQPANNVEESLGLLWCQGGGRLVQDQDARATIEGLDDLDPLLQANGQVPNTRSRIDLEPIPGREIADNAGGFIHINHASAPDDLVAEHDVLHDGQPGDQHEVLMHHPDAQLDRILRSSDVHQAAIELDLAGIACHHAIDDVHQSRFAGAVLTEKRVDPAPVDDQVHAVYRPQASEGFSDPSELERGRLLRK